MKRRKQASAVHVAAVRRQTVKALIDAHGPCGLDAFGDLEVVERVAKRVGVPFRWLIRQLGLGEAVAECRQWVPEAGGL